jgi:hypothetical protein
MANPSTSVESTAGGAIALKPLSHSNNADSSSVQLVAGDHNHNHNHNHDHDHEHEHSTATSNTEHVAELSNWKFLVIILSVGGVGFLSSFVSGLLTVGLPRTAEDIGLSEDLVFW